MRHYRGDEAGAFFHVDFQKGRLDLAEKMACCKHLDMAKPTQMARKRQYIESAVPSASVVVPRNMQFQTPLLRSPESPPMPTQLTNAFEELNVYQGGYGAMDLSMAGVHPQLLSMDSNAIHSLQHPPMEAQPDLNAAIEREVSRRLQERINAAAINRLVRFQEQANVSPFSHVPFPQPPLAQNSFHHQAQQLAPTQFVSAWNLPGSAMSWNRSALAVAAQNLYGSNSLYGAKPPLPQISYAAAAAEYDLQLLPSLPPTNIRGAKTA